MPFSTTRASRTPTWEESRVTTARSLARRFLTAAALSGIGLVILTRYEPTGLVKELELLLDWSLCPSGLATGTVLDALAFAARRTMFSCTKETAPIAWMPVLAFAEQEIQR